MEKFYELVIRHRKIIFAVFIGIAVICAMAQKFVSVNYDMNSYLPEDSPSTVALDVMEDEFDGGIPNARVLIYNVTVPEALSYKEKLGEIDGVTDVTWLDDTVTAKIGELAANGDQEANALYQCAATGNTGIVSNYITMAGKLINLETLLNADAAYISGSDTLIAGIDGALDSTNGDLMKGALALQSSYAEFDTAISGMVTTSSSLADNMTTLKKGIDTLAANYNTLDTGINDYTSAVNKITTGYASITGGAKDLADGTATLYQGTQELVKGTQSLKDGAGTLSAGTESLLNGALSLQSGAGQLADNTLTLQNGSKSLAEGAAALKDGTKEMKDGTKELSDGTDEFQSETADLDTKISDKISDTIDDMTGKDVETVSFVSEKIQTLNQCCLSLRHRQSRKRK